MGLLVTLVCMLFHVWIAVAEFKEAPYASWAHSHVVWINSKQQNQGDVIKMVDDYLASTYFLI